MIQSMINYSKGYKQYNVKIKLKIKSGTLVGATNKKYYLISSYKLENILNLTNVSYKQTKLNAKVFLVF